MTETQCRLCLQYIECTFKLGDNVGGHIPIWEVVTRMADVSIAVDDPFPQAVCWICVSKLDQVLQFKLEVEKSDTVLRSNHFEFQTSVKKEDLSDKEDIFEPTVIIKSKSGRVIRQRPDIYKEEDDKPKKLQKEIKVEPSNGIVSPEKSKEKKPKPRPKRRRGEPKPPVVHRCCMCQTLFTTETDLEFHVDSTHFPLIEENIAHKYSAKHYYNCKYCKQKFRLARSLEEHFNVPHFKEPPRNRTNEYLNKKQRDLSKGEKIHKEFVCTFCGKVYSTRLLIKEHEMKYHAQHLPIICPHPGCERRFASKTFMNKHVKIHGEKTHICDTCGRAFLFEKTLISHSYLHKEVKRYHCAHCPRTFTYRGMIKRHIESHFEAKIYRCDQCEKTYKWDSDLKRHVQGAHLGDLPYKCKYCSKGYIARSSRKYHEDRCAMAR